MGTNLGLEACARLPKIALDRGRNTSEYLAASVQNPLEIGGERAALVVP